MEKITIAADSILLPSDIVSALYDTLQRGNQFYTLLAGRTWLFFYNGPALIH